MPIRYTTRLIAVRTEAGSLRVLCAAPVDVHHRQACERFVTFEGPRVVQPPAGELSDAEFNRWQYGVAEEPGFRLVPPDPDLNLLTAPLVEWRLTVEDLVPAGAVTWSLAWVRNPDGVRTVGVACSSSWNRTIPNFSLAAVWEAQEPQPVPDAPPELDLRLRGESYHAFTRVSVGGPALNPGLPGVFAFDPSWLPEWRSAAASLSPEHHWVALETDGHEFARIPGAAVAGFFDRPEPADGEMG
jgi:hypothetical protein